MAIVGQFDRPDPTALTSASLGRRDPAASDRRQAHRVLRSKWIKTGRPRRQKRDRHIGRDRSTRDHATRFAGGWRMVVRVRDIVQRALGKKRMAQGF